MKKEPVVIAGRNPASEFFRDWEETADVASALAVSRRAEAAGHLKKARAWLAVARFRVERHMKEMQR